MSYIVNMQTQTEIAAMNTKSNNISTNKDLRSEYVNFTTGYSLNNELMAERKPIKPEEKPVYGDPSDSSTWSVV